ncbi:alpha/beta fold hydrolase [Amorphoplanes digitatis]|uniref:Pimeloyl-ACP methyl ester carboxylesterase n=1 Tax=Actinoplanes digitatis TaxID=1868 RepID=A0A7W7MSQ7_9ACTN|nr:alpha/beta fold hydrolase [Actinoplanes digitatis]MBB4764809.1 pimeloyl-ACP methyl ester carboxylesterase [Actinoplanes digitatis]GID91238.1 hydrolase [Actinoplanes digitatis]
MDERRTVELHGHARAFRLLGTGPTVLLLVHGIGSDGLTWDAVAPAFAERYTVLVPDLLGHGRSAKPRADYSIGGYANGMRDLLGALDIDRVTVVGHSFGGGVAMQFAYQFPERTDRLVVVAGGGLGPQVSVAFRALTLPGASVALGLSHLPPSRLALGALRAAAGLVAPAALAADLNEAYTVHTGLRDPAARSAFLHVLRHVADWRGQLITMRDRAYLAQGLPALVVWGDQDHVLPVGHAEAAAELLPGARSVVLPGVGHFPHREAAEEFVRAVTDFIEETQPKSWDARRWRHLLQTHSGVARAVAVEDAVQ